MHMKDQLNDKDYCAALADLLFPVAADKEDNGDGSLCLALCPDTLRPDDYEVMYPPRGLPGGAKVTRLGPSPTGFVHLGNLFMAVVNQRLANQSGGVFFLRVEDTDQKREVEGAVPALLSSLRYFGVDFDEGVCVADAGDGGLAERGEYGPYFQSARYEIYRSFARKLVLEGKAYPCFLTEEQIDGIRAAQETAKELPGIYGDFAKWRGADIDTVSAHIETGEPYVIRFFAEHDGAADTAGEATEYPTDSGGEAGAANSTEDTDGVNAVGGAVGADGSTCSTGETITVRDGIRGDIRMPKNIMDVVILKTDGLPTYHFAHVVDDHLMRTTHVVRGEEWLSSLPVHIALSGALGFEPPVYCHTALLMKLDGGVKRKLSKRKDPELALSYYISEGYHPLAVTEYMLTIINSDYEEWRLANPDADNRDFTVTTEKMGAAGIMFDLEKLRNISRDTLARIPAEELAAFMLGWAKSERPDVFTIFSENKAVLTAALDIGRSGEKPRKDLSHASQILDFISYFFDPLFRMEDPLPDGITEEEARKLLEGYLAEYDHGDGREQWFEKMRELSARHGYAPKPKDYKNSPEMYKGHVGDVSAVIRRALTGRTNAPDIYEIQQILGENRVRARLG